MKHIWSVLLFLGICVGISHAHDGYLPPLQQSVCTHADGSSTFVTYAYNLDLLAVRDRQLGNVLAEIDHFGGSRVYLREWSPNCHYLVGQVDGSYVVWDMVNGGRAAMTAALPQYVDDIPVTNVTWEAGDLLLIHYIEPGNSPAPIAVYIWDAFHDRIIPLLAIEENVLKKDCQFNEWKFDLANQEVWIAQICQYQASGVRRYSLLDGALLAEYVVEWAGVYTTMDYRLSEDHQFVVVSHFGSNYVQVYRRDGTLLGNLHTLHTYLPQHALSPDGRFYVIVQNQLRVWDLTQLTPDATENLTFEGSDRVMTAVRFLDGTTVETTNEDGVIQRWNVLTGELLP